MSFRALVLTQARTQGDGAIETLDESKCRRAIDRGRSSTRRSITRTASC